MSDFDFEIPSFFIYYSEFKLLLCSICQVCLNSKNFKKHAEFHISKPISDFQVILISNLDKLNIISSQDSLKLILNQRNPIQNFKEFPIFQNLYFCQGSENCNLYIKNIKNLQKHLKKSHDISVSISSILNYSQLFEFGQSLEINRSFFPVQKKDKQISLLEESSIQEEIVASNSESESEFDPESTLDKASLEYLEQFSRKEKFLEDQNQILILNSVLDKLSPFQKKTGYYKFLKNRNLRKLVDYTTIWNSKDSLEPLLGILNSEVEQLFYSSLEKSLYLNRNQRNILSSFEANKVTTKGFRILQNSSSIQRYISFFCQFFNFLFRTQSEFRDKLAENSDYKPFYLFNSQELDIWSSIIRLGDEIQASNSQILNSKSSLKRFQKAASNQIQTNPEDQEDIDSNSDSSYSSKSLESIGELQSNQESDLDSNSGVEDFDTSSILERVRLIEVNKSSKSRLVQEKLLELFILLSQREVEFSIFISPVHIFFACISIKASNLTLKDSQDLSQYYSRFIYCYQLLVVNYSFQKLIALNQDSLEEIPSLSLTSLISDFISNYFQNSCSSILAEILNNRSYSFKVNSNSSSLSLVSIDSQEEQTLIYKNIKISVKELELLFQSIISTCYKSLYTDLLEQFQVEDLESITLEYWSKFEDISNIDPGQSFRELNPGWKKYKTLLRTKVLSSRTLRNRFFYIENNFLVLNRLSTKQFIREIREFLNLLLVAIYWTSGLPARGTEISIIKFKNSVKSQRELFLDSSSNLFLIKLSYSKTQNIQERKASGLRYLCSSLSSILLVYLVVLEPFLEFLEISLKVPTSENLWLFKTENQLLDSRSLANKSKSFSVLTIGKKLNIQNFRQIIVAIIRYFLQIQLDIKSLILEEEFQTTSDQEYQNIISGQMNHSFNTKELVYGRLISNFRDIKYNTQVQYLKFCYSFFKFFNILDFESQKFRVISDQDSIIQSLYLEEQVKKNSRNSILDLEALKSGKSSKKHLRNQSSISNSLENSSIVKKLKLKDLLTYSSISFFENNLDRFLQEFLDNPEAKYNTPEQKALVKAILLKVPFIIGVLPTNSGKTFSFLLTCSLQNSKVTIAIIPLVGLKQNILSKAREYNIEASDYNKDSNFSNLTLVSVETLLSEDFLVKLEALNRREQLDRIIFDEIHLIITQASFRTIFNKVQQIFQISTQYIFLTGSLPISLETELIDKLLLEKPLVIRGRSTRSDISYRIITYKVQSSTSRILEIAKKIREFQRSLSNFKDKILVFCLSIADIQSLQEALDCLNYYTDLENKDQILKDFTSIFSFSTQVLLSTSALTEGFDYPSIRFVVQIDFAFSVIDFFQASSRAARDNKPGISVVITTEKEFRPRIESLEKSQFREYLNQKVCRRSFLDYYFDLILSESCKTSQEFCDLCFQRKKIQKESQQNLISFNQKIEKNRLVLQNSIQEVSNSGCIFCRFRSLDYSHLFSNCPELGSSISESDIYQIVKDITSSQISLFKDSCCFSCFKPTIICKSLINSNKDWLCYNQKFFFYFTWVLYKTQNFNQLESKYSIKITLDLESFIRSLTRKLYSKELNTEIILLIQIYSDILELKFSL